MRNTIAHIATSLSDSKVLDCLAHEGLLSSAQLQQITALKAINKDSSALDLVFKAAFVPQERAIPAIANRYGIRLIDRQEVLNRSHSHRTACEALGLSLQWCKDNKTVVAPLGDQKTTFEFILCQTPAPGLISFFEQMQSDQLFRFEVALALPADIVSFYEQFNALSSQQDAEQLSQTTSTDLQHLRELAEEGPVIELFNSLLSRSVHARSSDLHLEPSSSGFVVRVRVDGVLLELDRFEQISYEALVCRIKILSALDIAERRLAQDGRLDAKVNGLAFDVRVSIIPSVRGESVVLRLLAQERTPQKLADLGLSEQHGQHLSQWLNQANGLVLVTGPTGSGKSTTLYTAMDLLGKRTDKIITVEDPVEYKLDGITQIQINADIGLDFPSALRSILRHDPDVILIGEIRDSATAQIATQAALTGHLVLSTLHTNTASGAVTRLLDLGVDSFLLADSLRGVMAQRLVRRLCSHCSQTLAIDDHEIPHKVRAILHQAVTASNQRSSDQDQAIHLKKAVGCPHCNGTGYQGRLGIYEFINFDAALKALIRPDITASEIEQHLKTDHQLMTWLDAWLKVAHGHTTWQEVTRNIYAEAV